MQQKKVPLRKCMGCMKQFPKKELVRVVKTKTGDEEYEISLDLTGKKAGRGAYLCKSAACLKAARKAKRIERALECQIPEEVYNKMESEIQNDV